VHLRLVAASSALVALLAVPMSAEPMKEGDRQRLLAHLEMTESWLGDELKGLSPAQLAFQMTPDSWSVAQVVEHLAIAEPQYWDSVQKSLAGEPTADTGPATDADILWYGIDRTRRDRTGEARVPHGTYKSAAESLAAFRKLRTTMREFARTTQADLRGFKLQGGNMSVYQWALMISTHAQRHILQIREIKSHEKFPKG